MDNGIKIVITTANCRFAKMGGCASMKVKC